MGETVIDLLAAIGSLVLTVLIVGPAVLMFTGYFNE